MAGRGAERLPAGLTRLLYFLPSIALVVGYTAACYAVGRIITAAMAPAAPEGLALAGPVGAAALALELWALGSVGIPWNMLTMALPPAAMALLARRLLARAIAADAALVRHWWVAGRGDILGREGVAVVVCALTALCLYGLVVQPLVAPDALAIWMFKAKLFFVHGRVDLAPVAVDAGRHLDYPPFYPLMADTLYVAAGGVFDHLGKAAAFPFVIALPVGLMLTLGRAAGRRLAGLFTAVAVSNPLLLNQVYLGGFMGYADYPQAVMLALTLGCLYGAERRRDPRVYGLTLVSAGVTALIKNEGMVFALAVAVVAGWRLARMGDAVARRALALGSMAMAPALLWRVVASADGYRSDLFNPADIARVLGPALPGRALAILDFGVHILSFLNDFGWILVGAVLAVELLVLRRIPGTRVLAIILGVQLAGYFAAYLFTPYPLVWHLSTSLDRVVLQVVPSIVILLALAAQPAPTTPAALQSARGVQLGPPDR